MSKADVDEFFAVVEEPKRSTLEEMRRRILEVVPDAAQTIKYGMPAFLKDGWCFACIAPFKNHINWSPYSSNVLAQLTEELEGQHAVRHRQTAAKVAYQEAHQGATC